MWARSILLAAVLAATTLPGAAFAADDGQNDHGRRHHNDDNRNHDGRRGNNNDNDGDNGRRQSFYGGRGLPGQEPQSSRGGDRLQGRGDGRNNRETQDDGRRNIRSLREIADLVRSRFGGDLISARLEDGSRPFYVLRWRMRNGDVRDFQVDAESGQIR
jgi:uncharacterized membrane protein YkoI